VARVGEREPGDFRWTAKFDRVGLCEGVPPTSVLGEDNRRDDRCGELDGGLVQATRFFEIGKRLRGPVVGSFPIGDG